MLIEIIKSSKNLTVIYETLWALSGYAKNTENKYNLMRPLYFDDSLFLIYISLIKSENIDIQIMTLELIGNVAGCFNYAREKILKSEIYTIIKEYYINCRTQIISSNFNPNINEKDSLIMEIYRKCIIFYHNCVRVKFELNHTLMFEIIDIFGDALKLNYKDKIILDYSILGLFHITYYDPLSYLHKIAELNIVSILRNINFLDSDQNLQYNIVVIIGNILVGDIETFDLMFKDGVFEYLMNIIRLGNKTRQTKHVIWCFSNIVAKYKKYKLYFVENEGLKTVSELLNNHECDLDTQSKIIKLIERATMYLDYEIVICLLEKGILELIKLALKISDKAETEVIILSIGRLFEQCQDKNEKSMFLITLEKQGGILFLENYELNEDENIASLSKSVRDIYDKINNEIDMELN